MGPDRYFQMGQIKTLSLEFSRKSVEIVWENHKVVKRIIVQKTSHNHSKHFNHMKIIQSMHRLRE